jgi:Fe2+ transport system protein B
MTITPHQTSHLDPLKSVIEEIPRQLEQSKELGNVLTDEDRQTIVKYLDFVKQNYNKKIQLLNDIEFNKKAIEDAEKKLATEIEENKINELRKKISDSEANIQSSKQMLDQILAYNERQFEDINMRLKSKFTLREKLGNIFRKYGLTITAITLALGLVIDTIVSALRGGGSGVPSGGVTGGRIRNNR